VFCGGYCAITTASHIQSCLIFYLVNTI
jgi:hypothetical protein